MSDDPEQNTPPHRAPGRPKGSRDRGPRKPRSPAPQPTPLAEVAADERDSRRRSGREKSFLRAPHGRAVTHGLPGPRVEVPPADEIADASSVKADKAPLPKGPRGRFLPGDASASEAGRAGGLSKKGTTGFSGGLGLSKGLLERMPEEVRRVLRRGMSYRVVRSADLAALSGGACGPGPSAMIAAGARDLAASIFVYQAALEESDPMEKAKLFAMASKISGNYRQHEIAAWELAQREGKARGAGGPPPDPLAGFAPRQALGAHAEAELPPEEPAAVADAANPNSTESVISLDGAPAEAVTSDDDRHG